MFSRRLLFQIVFMAAASIVAAFWLSDNNSNNNEEVVLPELEAKIFDGKNATTASRNKKVMVLLSGFPDNHDMWNSQIAAFQDDYTIISLCTPDMDQSQLGRTWGYNFTEIPIMLRQSLDKVLREDQKIDVLMTHDWGCVWGYYLLANNNRVVVKHIALDIGASPSSDPAVPYLTVFRDYYALWYQMFAIMVFYIGNLVSPWLAQEVLLPVGWWMNDYVGPMHGGFNWATDAPRPQAEIQWWMAYPYYQFWITYLANGQYPPTTVFPPVPTLFVYGTLKRTTYHTDEFLQRLENTPGCQVMEYADCSHWMMHEQPTRFNKDIRLFLEQETIM